MAVTLRDVARRAGVSPRTVSNVVNDFELVSDETRSRVREAIEELGYQPNLVARNLRSGRSGMIGLAIPEILVPYFSELSGAVIEHARRRSYTVIIEQTGGDPEEEQLLLKRSGRTQLFDGLIFSPLGIGADDLAASESDQPLVLLGERIVEGPFDHIAIDNVAAARRATQHLIDIGRRRIAAIGAQRNELGHTGRYRTKGYKQALKAAGRPFDRRLLAEAPQFHRDCGAAAMNRLLELAEPPDAVFCYNDLLALGAMRAVLSRGLRVPADVAIVGFDDIEDGRYSTPTLTTVAPDKARIGQAAVDLLLARLSGSKQAPADIEAPWELKIRESTCPRA